MPLVNSKLHTERLAKLHQKVGGTSLSLVQSERLPATKRNPVRHREFPNAFQPSNQTLPMYVLSKASTERLRPRGRKQQSNPKLRPPFPAFPRGLVPNRGSSLQVVLAYPRFLRDLSDFETYMSPDFRHPPLLGTVDDLESVGLLREALVLDMFYDREHAE